MEQLENEIKTFILVFTLFCLHKKLANTHKKIQEASHVKEKLIAEALD